MSLAEVAEMSLDQIFMLLTDRKYLKSKGGRLRNLSPLESVSLADKNGFIKGRAADGSLIKAKISGKSKVQRLMEEAVKKKKEEKAQQRLARRRKRRGN